MMATLLCLQVKDDLVRQPFFVAKMYINEAEPQIAEVLTRASSVLKTVRTPPQKEKAT